MFILLLLAPDISMIGYLKDKKFGSFTYNLVHNYALAVVLMVGAYILKNDLLLKFGIILTAHISMDRALGFGLKLSSGFKDTHLGKMGN
jgi:hypothetical protein